MFPINVNECRARRAKLRADSEALITTAQKAKRDLTPSEQAAFDDKVLQIKDINETLDGHQRNSGLGTMQIPSLSEKLPKDGHLSPEVNEALSAVTAFVRTGKVMATDNPLQINTSPAGGLAATVPVQVLDGLRSYYANDAFRLAGSTFYYTDSTAPLIKPIVSAGADLDVFAEGQSATESHPMQIDSFTFNGTKISRLVKASEVSLMNSDLQQQGLGSAGDLAGEILDELVVAVTNTGTHMATTALETALHSNPSCYIDKSHYSDVYGALLGLLLAVPPRFASPTNAYMMSRADLRIIKDVRSTQNEPLFDPESSTIFGRKVVINDNLSHVVFGDWSSGAFIRKSGFVLQRLIELYSTAGQIGFKATVFQDSKFLASVPAVPVQPLYYTNLDTAGS